ncbi:hypothetical protein ACA097_26785 [Pseudomonas sp. QL9]|uniref:hypothetical protein n=1 Tax=Pseudomonas sp. QL9 TaxID=3242725 RepID=UPI00352A6A0E
MKVIFIIFIFGFSSVCAAADIGVGFFEILSIEQGGQIYLHSSVRLDKNDAVNFQYQTDAGVTACCGRVESNAFTYVGQSQKVSTQAGTYGFLYQANLKGPALEMPEGFGIAVINADTVKGVSPDRITAVKEGEVIAFEKCYGMEGINLYEKSRGRLLEHLYFYLNIDIEPTCP